MLGVEIGGRFDAAGDLSRGEGGDNLVAWLKVLGVVDDVSLDGSRHRVASTEHVEWAEGLESGGGGSELFLARADLVPGGSIDALLQQVDLFGEFMNPAMWSDEDGPGCECIELCSCVLSVLPECTGESSAYCVDCVSEFILVRDDQFAGFAGRECSFVGDEVGDTDVDFVSDGADDRYRAIGDGSSDDFFVEGPEVFEASASTSGNDDIDARQLRDHADGLSDFFGRPGSLDSDGQQYDFDGRPSSGDDLQHVPESGSGGAGDQCDPFREGGDGLFAIGVEEAFVGQSFLQLSKRQFQGSDALGDQLTDDQLVLASRQVDFDSATGHDFESIGEIKREAGGGVAPDDGRDLGLVVLEREIDVSGSSGSAVRDFSGDPHIGVVSFESVLDLSSQFRNGPSRFAGIVLCRYWHQDRHLHALTSSKPFRLSCRFGPDRLQHSHGSQGVAGRVVTGPGPGGQPAVVFGFGEHCQHFVPRHFALSDGDFAVGPVGCSHRIPGPDVMDHVVEFAKRLDRIPTSSGPGGRVEVDADRARVDIVQECPEGLQIAGGDVDDRDGSDMISVSSEVVEDFDEQVAVVPAGFVGLGIVVAGVDRDGSDVQGEHFGAECLGEGQCPADGFDARLEIGAVRESSASWKRGCSEGEAKFIEMFAEVSDGAGREVGRLDHVSRVEKHSLDSSRGRLFQGRLES